jgi:hypothetical protein
MAESEKYSKAVTKATGQGETAMTTEPPPGAEAMVTKLHPDALQKQINDDLRSGKFEAAPQIFKFEQGMMIEGFLEGNGPSHDFVDADTGEVTTVKTWILADKSRSVRISILSSAQLDRKLNGFIGSWVKIARGKEVNIEGSRKRMTEYLVWGPKLPGGKERQWFDVPNEARLAAGNSHHALPSGNDSDPS